MQLTAFDSVSRAFDLLFRFWWAYLPVLMVVETLHLYQRYTRKKFLLGLKWVMLEITPPPDVPRSPKGAESLFAGLHGIYTSPLSWKDKFFQGKLQNWFSFEIAGIEGQMHFFVRLQEAHRNLFESEFFAQYPDAEISVVEDYLNQLPVRLPNDEYDLFGSELIFTKEDAYPLKTYEDFEEKPAAGKNDFKRTDPLAPLAETMGLLGPGEILCVQLLIRPTGGDWVKAAQAVIDKLSGKSPKKQSNAPLEFMQSIEELAGIAAPAAEKKEEKAPQLTGGQKTVMDKIENKISKIGFKSAYRVMYIARKEAFSPTRVPSVIGYFKQFYSNSTNSFKPNPQTMTLSKGYLKQIFPSDKGLFAAQIIFKRKVKMYKDFRARMMPKKVCVLNTEELATVYHMPDIFVQAPALPRVPAKKGQPPGLLPT